MSQCPQNRIGYRRPGANRDERLWVLKREKYGAIFCAKAPTPEASNVAPRCIEIEHLFSIVLHYGTRIYAFVSAEQRDAFVRAYSTAEACGDPVPCR